MLLVELTPRSGTYGTTTFANTFAYAPSGAMLSETWGNSAVHSIAYNNAHQVSQIKLKQSSGGSDGRMKSSHDVRDNRFDRSYEFDQMGRLTKALSGAEARGEPATNDRPYKETATYDAFDHLNVRSSKHWSRVLGFGSSDTYSNNRRVGWTYDADGNWLSGAGRPAHVRRSWKNQQHYLDRRLF